MEFGHEYFAIPVKKRQIGVSLMTGNQDYKKKYLGRNEKISDPRIELLLSACSS